MDDLITIDVSTRSRAKAAGTGHHLYQSRNRRFNSQPREGGWDSSYL